MVGTSLSRSKTALLVIDVQESLFHQVERSHDILNMMQKAIQGSQVLQIPIVISEQYPQGLGETITPLQALLGHQYKPWIKSTFSCTDDPALHQYLKNLPYQQWILVGIEAHICVLQTAKGLLQMGKEVIILNDAISSRSIYDFSTAIAELRDEGARITSTETALFELLRDSHAPEFKQISSIVKARCGCC